MGELTSFRAGSRDGIVAGIALACFALALFAPQVLNDGDTWWHVAVGRWILEHGQAPTADLWSYSRAGSPWTAHEWLSELLMAGAYGVGGWSAVVAMSAVAFGLAAWILGRRLARNLSGLALMVMLVLALSLIGPSLLARPHILALPILAGWTSALLAARERGAAPSLWLAPLMTLWANLHGGWAFGVALVGPFALEALLAAGPGARLKAVWGWGLFGLAALGAAAITPFGIEGLLFPLKLMSMKSLAGIGEWRPVDFSRADPLEIVLLALVGFGLTRPVRVPMVRLILLAGLIDLALSQGRHAMLLGVVGAMLLAGPVAAALEPGQASGAARARPGWASGACAVAAILLLTVRLTLPLSRVDSPTAPIAALAAVPQAVRAQPMLNDYAFGGYLIWKGLRPFVDSRAEVYGDRFLSEYSALILPDPRALDTALARNGATWTIFAPDQPVVKLMDARPGWRRLYADRFAVVHVRTQDAS